MTAAKTIIDSIKEKERMLAYRNESLLKDHVKEVFNKVKKEEKFPSKLKNVNLDTLRDQLINLNHSYRKKNNSEFE